MPQARAGPILQLPRRVLECTLGRIHCKGGEMLKFSKLANELKKRRREVRGELDYLDKAILTLRKLAGGTSPKATRTLSLAARKRIAAAQKARWARWRRRRKKR
jgi:hypothetical protein